jgi:signal transduction histidine kinase
VKIPLRFEAAMRRRIIRTAVITAAIVAAAVALDFLAHEVLFPGAGQFTPVSTMAIALLVAPPFTYYIISQAENVRAAREQAMAAEAVNVARTRFLANVSHELRTPLNAIINYSELMLEAAEADGRTRDVADHRRVMRASDRLLQLVNDLIDIAKLEAGEMRVNAAPFAIAALLKDAAAGVCATMVANANTMRIHVGEGLEEGFTDAARLRQCLVNLLSNAAKFTQGGTVTMRAERALVQGADWLVVSVSDTGPGIARERLADLFEPFMRAEAIDAAANGGTGLGLPVTRRLAMLLGGGVEVESELGRGARFMLSVPLRYDEAAAPAAARAAPLTLAPRDAA